MGTLFPKKVTFCLMFITLLMLVGLISEVWRYQKSLTELQKEYIPALELSAIVVRINEVLNHVVQIYLVTRDKKYQLRYQDYSYAINDSISQLFKAIPKSFHFKYLSKEISRNDLTEIESVIMKNHNNLKTKSIKTMLDDYEKKSDAFKLQIIDITENLNRLLEDNLEDNRSRTQKLFYVGSLGLVIWSVLWILLIKIYHHNSLIRLEAENNLNESQQRFKDIALTTGDWIWEIDDKLNITYSSGSIANMFGENDLELIGKPLMNFFDKNGNDWAFDLLTKEIAKQGSIVALEYWLNKKNDNKKCVLVNAIVMRDEFNNFKGYRGSCKNITEEKIIEEERENFQKQMFQSSKMASIGALAAGVGHEINNPLAIIQGNLEILALNLKEKLIPETLWVELVKKQEESVRRIVDIVNGLKTYGRKDNDVIETFEINDIIEKSILFLHVIYEKEGVVLKKDLSFEKCFIDGNIGKMQQVIVNLLSNAKDATESKEKRIVSISTKRKDHRVLIEISDNGTGIPDDILVKIFEQFFTTKEIGKGTGLGLAIVKNIVENIGGIIHVESNYGKGAKFIIDLPISNNVIIAKKEQESIVINKLQGKVLIVDDEPDIRELLFVYMQGFGLEVHMAENGQIALEKVQHNSFDYVVTDFTMPVMDGVTLVHKLREQLTFSGKIFMITGAVIEDLKDLPVDGFIAKPFNKKSIYQMLTSDS